MATRNAPLPKETGSQVDGLEGARRATGEPVVPVSSAPDPEVVAIAKRRRFAPAYKRKMVRAVAACKPGEVGALLRREGLYSSHLTLWRRELEALEDSTLSAKPRGPKPDPDKAHACRVEALEHDLSRLRDKLERAEQIIEAQKKLCDLLGLPTGEAPRR